MSDVPRLPAGNRATERLRATPPASRPRVRLLPLAVVGALALIMVGVIAVGVVRAAGAGRQRRAGGGADLRRAALRHDGQD